MLLIFTIARLATLTYLKEHFLSGVLHQTTCSIFNKQEHIYWERLSTVEMHLRDAVDDKDIELLRQ
jgi:hypothetical protein